MIDSLRTWSVWKARSRLVVFLQNPSDVKTWIEILWKRTRAVNVLAVVLDNPPQYFTWFPYQPEECSNVSRIVRINPSNLFPQKINPPLNDCPLIAVHTRSPPFVLNETHGIESRAFLDLAKKLGMTPGFAKLAPGMNVWICFDSKQQPYNGLKLLFENDIDLMFSQIAMTQRTSAFAEFLLPHSTEDYLFFVPGPVEAPRATVIFRAFSPKAWIFVSIASIIIYLTVAVIPLIETRKFQSAFVHSVAIILNVPTNFPPSRALQFFSVAAYIYSLHITTAYTASFIIFLSDVPRERPITSLQDIVDSNFKVQIHIAMQGAMNQLSTSPLIHALNQPNRTVVANRLNLTLVRERKFVMLGPKISYQFELLKDEFFDEFDHPKVLVIRPSLFSSFLTYYVSKGHPLYEHMNRYLIWLIEGGFLGFYSDELGKPPRPERRNLEAFGVENVEGPFILLLGMLGGCILVYLCEWVWYWIRKPRGGKLVRGSQSSRNKLRFSKMFRILSREIKVNNNF